jgi:putative tryptophan/tyrosine transport system substrate-binding protein
MRRRDFIALLLGGAAAWPVAARAQQPRTRMPRIGWLVTGDPTSYRFSLAAFRDGLRALNYIEGQSIAIEYRWAEGNVARLPELAKDLVDREVDIILAGGSLGAQAAKDATSVIPIVAAGVGDLVELGLVTNLAKPGGNLTGFVASAPETAAKRMQIMKEIMPQSRRAAVLWNPTSSAAQLEWNAVKQSAAAVELAFTFHEVRTSKELENTLVMIPQLGPDMLVVLNDPFMFTYRKGIVDAALRLLLPSIYGYREYADDGGLISYGASISGTYRRAAVYVDKIIKGTRPGDLPVQLPTKFELVINLKTAKALGLTVPPSLLGRADELIE